MVSIHKEGHRILLLLLILLVAVNLLLYYYQWISENTQSIVTIISIVVFLAITSFFRNPPRLTLSDIKHVIAPADGKVVVIEEVEENEYFKTKRLQLSIFMSPANVHVNRNPISGTVKYTKYHPGKYLVAWHPKSSIKNERNTIVIGNNEAEILIRQVAGAMARRIVSYLNPGDVVEQGKDLGFIKFGSRVDLFLPLDAVIEVNLNAKVKGGETVIARLK